MHFAGAPLGAPGIARNDPRARHHRGVHHRGPGDPRAARLATGAVRSRARRVEYSSALSPGTQELCEKRCATPPCAGIQPAGCGQVLVPDSSDPAGVSTEPPIGDGFHNDETLEGGLAGAPDRLRPGTLAGTVLGASRHHSSGWRMRSRESGSIRWPTRRYDYEQAPHRRPAWIPATRVGRFFARIPCAQRSPDRPLPPPGATGRRPRSSERGAR